MLLQLCKLQPPAENYKKVSKNCKKGGGLDAQPLTVFGIVRVV